MFYAGQGDNQIRSYQNKKMYKIVLEQNQHMMTVRQMT